MLVSCNRMILIYQPVVIFISLPEGSSTTQWHEYNLNSADEDEESIRFVYFHMGDNSLPPHILDILSDREIAPIQWERFQITSPSLACCISEGLLKIGVRA